MQYLTRKATAAAPWLLPALFCVWLYWFGLKAWFQQDDFAWLGLHTQVHDWLSFLRQMFEPMAQGTIRPWSERGFFLLFYQLFGADALPYRIAVFATQIANLVLLAWIVMRLTASRAAAFAAPLFWTANAALSSAMSWTAVYNEVLCAFFLLAAFALYLRGRYWLQLAVFVLGFGALELNVVYPALLLCYVLASRRTREDLLRLIPLFAISVAYYAIHAWASPSPRSGPYALHMDAGILRTFGRYWERSFAPGMPKFALGATVFFTALLLWHVVREARKRRYLPIFFALWFVITLTPFLPVRDHFSDYYLTVPTIGLAMLLADASASHATLLAAVSILYLWLQIPIARNRARWYFDRSHEIRGVVLGIQHARELHPGRTILLTDVEPQLYNLALANSPFQALDIPDVYLSAEAARAIPHVGALADVNQFVLPPGPTAQGILNRQIEVYSLAENHPRNITSVYELTAGAASEKDEKEFPRRVDIGAPFLGYLLGSTWYPLEVNHRWMPKWASVRMGGPRTANEKLILTGYCPAGQISKGPLKLRITVNGKPLAGTEFTKPETPFSRSFSLPPDLVGAAYVDVNLEVDRTFRTIAGGRELGLAFGVLEIQ